MRDDETGCSLATSLNSSVCYLGNVESLRHRRRRELQVEAACRSECNQLGKRVTARLKHFGVTDGASPGEDCE